ncbi:MAG: gamma-glutamyl-gamma-aminobutyrate hydrolase family protein [Acidobacteriaceae bacterium]|nr:gamma-glutamyl-gamma-aminobutyrate hydrolase family protein [Acidobacteriaceae bacterium]MBV9038040.1 gamma-glutamyl-gamma-aminobutyrate hydrolase family protein [Acidobacteriaceae bacterium]
MKRVLIPYRHLKKLGPYVEAVRASGLEAVPISVAEAPTINGFHGLLLMGGTDVNPKLYGEAARPEVDQPDDERDAVEWRLIDEALGGDLPILAICRGMQLLNVHRGGTLIQHLDLPKHDTDFEDKATVAHEVVLQPQSQMAEIAGAPCLQVNSRHHQAVDRIGEALQVSARDSEDGTIEALEGLGRSFVIAVQWHPEDQVFRQTEQMNLFKRFAGAC